MASVHTAFKNLVLAGMLATAGYAAVAADAPPPPPPGAGMEHHDPAKMHERMLKHMAALKAKLQLTSAQESAWTTFTTSMQPPAPTGTRPDRAEIAKLTTPERIDKMRAMRAERDAAMDKRADATKAFYAALTPEQQKVFDANAMPHGGPGGPGEHGPDGHPHKG
jgi:protein CpxP